MGLFNTAAKKRRAAEREEEERRDRIRSEQRMENSYLLDATNINSPLNPIHTGIDCAPDSSSTDCSSGDSDGGGVT